MKPLATAKPSPTPPAPPRRREGAGTQIHAIPVVIGDARLAADDADLIGPSIAFPTMRMGQSVGEWATALAIRMARAR